MNTRQHTTNEAPCTEVMKVIGDYWTMNIVQAIGSQSRRFCEIERILGDSNPVTLTSRLKKLESFGLITRTKDPKDKICVYYTLTARGKELVPIAKKIEKFAESFSVSK
ncbi:MAG: putative HxlR family transcriptional regulator [Candidatus Nomurabacteria bacterium]|nr:putative HxlR family transcriptional regulator [Candidatus Nomurabacteria bacterium]